VSQLADRYVKDPNDVVQVGQKVKVTVQSVDLARGRIALSMRSDGGAPGAPSDRAGSASGTRGDVRAHERRSDARGSNRPAGKPAAPQKPAFVPTKGAVAPNGIRFK